MPSGPRSTSKRQPPEIPPLTFQIEKMAAVLGAPRLDLFVPGLPATRPSGKPFYSSARNRHKLNARQGIKADASARYLEYRRRLQRHADEHLINLGYRREVFVGRLGRWTPLEGALSSFMEFFFPNPQTPKHQPEIRLKDTRPDDKNLMFGCQDALSPDPNALWPGLWIDDAQLNTLGAKYYVADPARVGTRIRVWQ